MRPVHSIIAAVHQTQAHSRGDASRLRGAPAGGVGCGACGTVDGAHNQSTPFTRAVFSMPAVPRSVPPKGSRSYSCYPCHLPSGCRARSAAAAKAARRLRRSRPCQVCHARLHTPAPAVVMPCYTGLHSLSVLRSLSNLLHPTGWGSLLNLMHPTGLGSLSSSMHSSCRPVHQGGGDAAPAHQRAQAGGDIQLCQQRGGPARHAEQVRRERAAM